MEPKPANTTALLLRMHGGDEEARSHLIERHLPAVKAYVRRKTGEQLRRKADASDFVQDAIVEFLKYAPRFTLRTEREFRALLCKIALNVLRGKHQLYAAQRRSMSRELPLGADSVLHLDIASSDNGPIPRLQNEDRRACLRMAMELLSPEEREVIWLHDFEGRPLREVAKRLEVSEEAAKKRFQRALPRLGLAVRKVAEGRITDLF